MPKLQLTSPNGGTLNTAGTYCDGDIEIIPKLQSKTVTENGTVTADDGFAGLVKVVVNVQSGGGGGDSTYYLRLIGAPILVKDTLCETFTADVRQGKIALPESVISYLQENINDETKMFFADIYINGLQVKENDDGWWTNYFPKLTFVVSAGQGQTLDYSEGTTFLRGTGCYVEAISISTALNEELTELSFNGKRSKVDTENIGNNEYCTPLDISTDENGEVVCTVIYKWATPEELGLA